MNKPIKIIIHCTDVSRKVQTVQFFSVNRYHRDERKFPKSSLGYYGGYHIFIEPDGTELRYREDWEMGAHCNQVENGLSMNEQSLGICWAGDGDTEYPTSAQMVTIAARVKSWGAKFNIPVDMIGVKFHRDYAVQKTCPGKLLDDSYFLRYINSTYQKDPEAQKKAAKEKEISSILDMIRELLLKIKIQLDLQTRSKSAPFGGFKY